MDVRLRHEMCPKVLVIASNERCAFEAILRRAGCPTLICAGRRDARDLLQRASVVICEDLFPDGSWRDVLRTTQGTRPPPAFIVTSQRADSRLWAEVLNLGGCDVLAQPLCEREVIWAVRSAHRRWQTAAEAEPPQRFAVPEKEKAGDRPATERKQAAVCLFGQSSSRAS